MHYLVKEYLQKNESYQKQYGEKTVLFYNVGSFFEIYGIKDHPSEIFVKKIGELCDLSIVSKKDLYVDKKQVFQGGFRDYNLDKYIEKLHPHGYTIVVYVQDGSGDDIKRVQHGIYSPGTTFLEQTQTLSNNMSCIWIQKVKTFLNQEQYVFGMSNINLMSGHSYVCENYENYYHNPTTYDTIETFLNIYNPVELILIHNVELDVIHGIVQFLQINSKKYHIIDVNNKEHTLSIQANNCENQVYQNDIIYSFFPNTNIEIFKYNIQDKPVAIQSYCFLLNFIRQHNAHIVENIHEPCVQEVNKILVCANHSLKQLNMIHSNEDYSKNIKNTSIVGLLNQCKTKMGKRSMNEILMNPINDHVLLEKSYSITEHFIKRKFILEKELSNIVDIEKIMTKMKMNRMCPCDIHNIVESHKFLEKIILRFSKKKDKCLWEPFHIDACFSKWKQFLDYIHNTFQLSTCSEMNHLQLDKFDEINTSLFQLNVNPTLDHLIQNKLENKDKLRVILEAIESLFHKKEKKKSEYLRQHQTKTGPLCYLITKNRSKTLQTNIQKKIDKNEHILTLSFYSNFTHQDETIELDLTQIIFKPCNFKDSFFITCDLMDGIISSMFMEQIQYNEELNKTYKNTIQHIYENYYTHLISFVETIKQIDVCYTKYVLCVQLNLCKPEIKTHETSFVDAKKMRHLLIEQIEQNETYVPNDICIGKENNKGILLYGTNAVGKTSLIKALGINVIMAQCGFHVPCESFIYCPYHYLFTRIIGNDNIFKGLSTFGVEMSELRVILNHCNKNSLILGDELCSGTEIDSALSIFIASLEIMSNQQSTFIFATHFHELQHMKQMKELKHICCKHLKVQYDHEKQQLFYDRTIHDGHGESIYGLEVCKSLKMDDSFLKRCYEIRNDYIDNKNNVLLMKTSKYNKDKLKHMCEFCNEELATEIHHLQYQKDANDTEYIANSFHKNHKANLASICESCHYHMHALHLRYVRRKTMDGTYEFILKKIE